MGTSRYLGGPVTIATSAYLCVILVLDMHMQPFLVALKAMSTSHSTPIAISANFPSSPSVSLDPSFFFPSRQPSIENSDNEKYPAKRRRLIKPNATFSQKIEFIDYIKIKKVSKTKAATKFDGKWPELQIKQPLISSLTM
ncbi:hypothetical protein K3495_g6049 [Podosphaera aphanis]|nr:hypothetical protein K3495_g6049 [Podosphaera aphanis]